MLRDESSCANTSDTGASTGTGCCASRTGAYTVIASGPSLKKEDCEKARKETQVIVVNNAVKYCPDADVLYACDLSWWDNYPELWKDFKGIKATWSKEASIKYGLTHYVGQNKPGLGKNIIHTGGNSGYQAVNLAYLLGAKRIFLLGFDMQLTNNQVHFHGKHTKSQNPDSGLLSKWVKNFQKLDEDLTNEGIELINLTRETALTCKRANIDELFC